MLPDPPPAEPYLYVQENQEGDEGVTDINPSQESLDEKEAQVNDDDLENELELDALMQENSDISDSSDGEDNLIPAGDKEPGKTKTKSAYESPVGTIAVLVVGCWTLRIPVMYRDFSRYDG